MTTANHRPYTAHDLRAEAARQLSAHGPGISREQVYAAMLDARIESADSSTWSEALDTPELDSPANTIHDLINGSADVSEWAVGLGADGLEPSPHVLNLDGDGHPLVRIHMAFHPDMDERDRQRFGFALARVMADNF
ncbi:hypothetical protein ACF06Q_09400 [Streptomyces leeuwenhoekii]|uniref:hypothetical protein n=1 Tax=Streptomyces leeuwenhoekii TaxID=1437453 RepID=UPI0036F8F30A